MERDGRTRLTSILVRQLERNREAMPTWVEQRNVVRAVVARVEERLHKHGKEIDQLFEDREKMDEEFTKKYDALVDVMSKQQAEAQASMEAKKCEMDASLIKETQMTQKLLHQEKHNAEIRQSLDVTVAKLETTQSEISIIQAENLQQLGSGASDGGQVFNCLVNLPGSVPGGGIGGERYGKKAHKVNQNWDGTWLVEFEDGQTLDNVNGEWIMEVGPELLQARGRLEAQLKQKERIFIERNAAEMEIRKAKDELQRQRSHAHKLEEFVRKLSTGNATSGFLLDPALKKEANSILAAATKLQAAKQSRPSTPPRVKQDDSNTEPFYGRRCASCDEYDIRWPPPGVSTVA